MKRVSSQALSIFVIVGLSGCGAITSVIPGVGSSKSTTKASKSSSDTSSPKRTSPTADHSSPELAVAKTREQSTAAAASGSKDIELSDNAKALLRGLKTSQEKCSLDKRPFDESDALNRQAGRLIGRCYAKNLSERVAKLSDDERRHPDIANAVAYTDKIVAKDAQWRAEAKEMVANKGRSRAMSAKVKKLTDRHMMRAMRIKKMKAGTREDFDASNLRVMEAEVKNAHKIGRIAQDCDKMFPEKSDQPDVCEIARNWKPLYVEWLPTWAEKRISYKVHDTAGAIRTLADTGVTYGKDIEKFKSWGKTVGDLEGRYENIFGVVNANLPRAVFKPLSALKKDFQAAQQKASKVQRWPKKRKHKDGGIQAAAKQAFASKGLSVKRVGLEFADWTIKKTARGVPLYRFRNATIMAQAKGEKFCRVYDGMSAKAEHKGGGRYTKAQIQFEGGERFMVSACK